MPRYCFDVNDGKVIVQDVEGSELPDLIAAEEEARQALGEMARDVLRGSTPTPLLSLRIRDHHGRHLLSLSLTYSVVHNHAMG